jgi:hypothetical protein
MAHVGPEHLPFTISLLPFFAAGLCLPPLVSDALHGRLVLGDGISIAVGAVVIGLWYWAILRSIRSRKAQQKTTLLGRELTSWIWAPPATFVIGLIFGFTVF